MNGGSDQQEWKRAAAVAAVRAEVRDGMVVGLGTGSTAAFAIEELARRVREEGLRIRGVPTSLASEQLAREFGIPLTSLSETPDVDIDGADEIDPRRNLIKGAGGAMTREKVVAVASRRLVIIADESKLVRAFTWSVPVEVLPFAEPLVRREFEARLPACPAVLRVRDGRPFVTDNGNHILDVSFPLGRPGPVTLGRTIRSITGVVEHGIFAAMNPVAYIGGPGGVRVLI